MNYGTLPQSQSSRNLAAIKLSTSNFADAYSQQADQIFSTHQNLKSFDSNPIRSNRSMKNTEFEGFLNQRNSSSMSMEKELLRARKEALS